MLFAKKFKWPYMVKFLGKNIMKIMANITKHQIDSSGFGPTFLLSQKVLFSESQPLKVTALVSQLRKSEISLSGESTLRVERKTKATMISATLIMSLWLPGRFKNTVLTVSVIKRFLHSFLSSWPSTTMQLISPFKWIRRSDKRTNLEDRG